MEFLRACAIKNNICEHTNKCYDCDLDKFIRSFDDYHDYNTCSEYIMAHPLIMDTFLNKWDVEHQVPSRIDVLKNILVNVFKIPEDNIDFGDVGPCGCVKCEDAVCDNCSYIDYWYAPFNGDTSWKL